MPSSNLLICRVLVAAGRSTSQLRPINSRPLSTGVRRHPCFRQAAHLSCTANKSPLLSFHNRLSSSATVPKDLRESIRKVNDAGFVMAKHLISGEAKDSNLVFSPLSIHAVLSLLTAGASGVTKDMLLSLLKAKSPSDLNSFYSDLVAPVLADGRQAGGPQLSSGNKIWADKSISLKPGFKQVADTVYKLDTSQVDFEDKAEEAVKQINQWVEDKTKGLTNELSVDSIKPLTRFFCSNAIRFKGVWDEAFDESLTEKDDFYLLDGSHVKVPFMTNSEEEQAVCAYDGFKVLRLPYKRGQEKRRFSMYIILPDAKDGLPSLVEKVCSQPGFLDSHIPEEHVEVGAFWIPKFKFSYEFEASKVLGRLGLVLPEGGGFMEMVDDPLVYVSSIRHKAFIEVDEKGTEAMAYTMADGMLTCSGPSFVPIISFVADHPFMYVIREDTTGAVLFIGQVLNPILE